MNTLKAFVVEDSPVVRESLIAALEELAPIEVIGVVDDERSAVRWMKTAENATDYSIMNTARQLLWLPTTREEKYKAKQAIDTFFMRAGDVLSAAAVYAGTGVLHLSVNQFAMGNIVLTLVWLAVALMILQPRRPFVWRVRREFATATAAVVMMLLAVDVGLGKQIIVGLFAVVSLIAGAPDQRQLSGRARCISASQIRVSQADPHRAFGCARCQCALKERLGQLEIMHGQEDIGRLQKLLS